MKQYNFCKENWEFTKDTGITMSVCLSAPVCLSANIHPCPSFCLYIYPCPSFLSTCPHQSPVLSEFANRTNDQTRVQRLAIILTLCSSPLKSAEVQSHILISWVTHSTSSNPRNKTISQVEAAYRLQRFPHNLIVCQGSGPSSFEEDDGHLMILALPGSDPMHQKLPLSN